MSRWRTLLLSPAARPLRFAGTGGIAGAIQVVLLALLIAHGWDALAANAVAFLLAAQVNFALSRLFTWHDRQPSGSLGAAWLLFHGSIAFTAALNMLTFAAARSIMPSLAASAAGIAVGALGNYFAGDWIVFRRQAAARFHQRRSASSANTSDGSTTRYAPGRSPSSAMFSTARKTKGVLMNRSTIAHRLLGTPTPQLLLAGTLIAAVLGGGLAVHAQTAQATKKPTTAPTRPPGGPPLAATVQTGSSSLLMITVTATKKTVTVHLTAATHYLVNGRPTAKAPRWMKGERVQVMATKGKDGSYTAQAVFVGTPSAGPPGMVPPINGTVVSVSSSTLTLKMAKGTRTTVRLTASTGPVDLE